MSFPIGSPGKPPGEGINIGETPSQVSKPRPKLREIAPIFKAEREKIMNEAAPPSARATFAEILPDLSIASPITTPNKTANESTSVQNSSRVWLLCGREVGVKL